MKLIGAVCIVISAFCFGYSASRRMRRRCEGLRRIVAALEYLKTRICVFDAPMRRAPYDTENAYGICGIFAGAADDMDRDGLRAAWRSSVSERGGTVFDGGDIEVILSIGDRLGSTDCENQRSNIDGAKEMLMRRLEEADGDYVRLGRLYRNGGLPFGILTALLFF